MKIVFDVANASMVKPILSAIELIKDHWVHAHLSGTDGKKWTYSSAGMGTIDFASIAGKTQRDSVFRSFHFGNHVC
jgi:sugar phosphate isomerase/epimerase